MISSADDRDLALRAWQGDADAFGELVLRYQRAVFGVAYRMLGNRHDAEDATQECFMRAFRAFERFDPNRPLRPWLKRIAANVCLNGLESRRVTPAALAADLGAAGEPAADLAEWLVTSEPTPEQSALRAEQSRRLWSAIWSLPPRYRAVIELRHFQELNYAEMAELLGRPLSDIKSDLSRARKMLAQRLAGETTD
jgi:RNA polymerase sigma-70 factor (ECF subfamily)